MQAKILDRTFVSKGPIIDVFHTDTDDWDQLSVTQYLINNNYYYLSIFVPCHQFKHIKVKQ